jgi:hypothetical protein
VYFPKRRSTTTSAVITEPASSGVAPILSCIPVLLVKLTVLGYGKIQAATKLLRLAGSPAPYIHVFSTFSHYGGN